MTWSRNIVASGPGLERDRPAAGALSTFRQQVNNCTRCGACLPSCPVYLASGDEALSARGRVMMMQAVFDGSLELTSSLAERFSKCLLCGACGEACASGVDIPGAILAMRYALASAGRRRLIRAGTHRLLGSSRRLMGAGSLAYRNLPASRLLPWWRDGVKRHLPQAGRRQLVSMIPEVSPAGNATSRVALFPGCAAELFYQQTATAAVRALNRAGVEVVLPRGLGCCGMPQRTLGDLAAANALEQQNLRLLAGAGIDAVVTVCSSCALTLRRAAAGTAEAPPVMDIHEMLAHDGSALARLSSSLAADPPWKGRLTWHDPCHMARGLGLSVEPREIISSLPGVEYVEAGDPACCGGGGLFGLQHYDLSLKIGLGRAETLAATGAGLIATGCPACRLQLDDMLNRLGSPVRTVHLVELLDGAASAQTRARMPAVSR